MGKDRRSSPRPRDESIRDSVTCRAKRGLTLLEMSIAMAILSVILAGVAMGFGASLKAVNSARRITGGSQYLESVMQNLSAQPYENLLAMNGNQFFDQPLLADSNFTVDLTTFEAEIDMLQIEATLRDRRTNRELGTITTMRTRR
jgi:prepilin-type N-terminal cleavage/methylation domain-containing protein